MPNLAESALDVAGIGAWEFDVATGRVTWSATMFRLHDLPPSDAPPPDTALSLYAPQAAMDAGKPWDIELLLSTAAGRSVRVRSRGRAMRMDGRTVKLVGVLEDITAHHELAVREARLSLVARQIDSIVMTLDRDGRMEWVNDAFTRTTGYTLDDVRGRTPGDVLNGPDTDPGTIGHIVASIRAGLGFEVEVLDYAKDGKKLWMAVACAPIRDAAGTVTGFISVETDVTVRREAEAKARSEAVERERTEALLRDILEALPSAVMAYDHDERLVLWNQEAARMLPAVAPLAVPGMTLTEMLRLSAEHDQYVDVGDTPEARAQWVARKLAAYRAPGGARTLHLPDGRTMQARECRSESGNLVCVRTDTTDLKRAEEELRIQAERDPLTMLANRAAFMGALERALARAADSPDSGGALLLLDVDYFKQINDTLGHDMGDALLVEIGARLRTLLRSGDVAARLGGDEFGVAIPGLADAQAAGPRIDAIHATLSAPMEFAGRRTQIGISLGATLFPRDGAEAAKLLKNADLALYEAKRSGRGRWATFRPEQATTAERHVHMADALRRALAQNRFTVALQPKRLLRGGGHAGFEALARWHDGTRWVPPTEFVPVAEDTGSTGALGRVVMAAALARVQEIRDAGLDPGRVAVNVTGPQLLDRDFMAETLEMLRRHGLRPADLELELTETILLGRAAERIDAVLREFSRLGVTLALDDFGTGYASLAHLSRLPIDRLKIDRSFVQGIGGAGGVIARTIVGLAHSLDMEAIAEGVETAEQLAFLEAAGCDAAQGYLFARPLATTAEAIAYLRCAHGPGAPPPGRLIAKIAHG